MAGVAAIGLFSSMALLTTMTGGIPPFEVIGLGFSVATLLAIAVGILTGENVGRLLGQPAGAWVLGIAGFFGYHFFYFMAMRLAPPAEANLLNYLWPVPCAAWPAPTCSWPEAAI